MFMPILDPAFYLFAIPAIVLVGIGKGGFGGSLALIAMPIMAFSAPAVTAAAIMLPVLLVMDAISVWSWRRTFSRRNLLTLLPGALLGTLAGWWLATSVSDATIRLMLGLLGLAFWLQHQLLPRLGLTARPPTAPSWPAGTLWGTVTGFTSFISHVGGPPLSIYLLPQRLTKEAFAGTMVMLFGILNVVKLPAFMQLGVMTPQVYATAAVLTPLAVAATWFGVWLVKRIDTALFFRVIYALLLVVSVKLVWDGASALLR
jgi:hypothetical protein